MNKLGAVLLVIIVVSIVYMFMIILMPFLTEIVSTANTTMAATSNMSNYPGSGELLVSTPWILWFVPVSLGTIAIVIIWRVM